MTSLPPASVVEEKNLYVGIAAYRTPIAALAEERVVLPVPFLSGIKVFIDKTLPSDAWELRSP